MLELICKRLLLAIPTLLLVSMMVFGLQKLLPGDPLIAMAGEERDPAVIAQLRAELNLDAPIPVQYFNWLTRALQGDLGVLTGNFAHKTEAYAKRKIQGFFSLSPKICNSLCNASRICPQKHLSFSKKAPKLFQEST